MMMKSIRRLGLVMLSGITAMISLGQEATKSSRKARFLAVGESPPYAQVVEGGIARELEPPAGSVPPRRLATLDPAAKADEDDPILELRLGRITAPVAIPAGEGALALREADADTKSPPWLTIRRPAEGDFLVLLWRKPGATTWDAPTSFVVPDGPLGAPAGSVVITNLFPATVGVQWGESYHVLKTGANHIKPLAAGAVAPFRIDGIDQAGKRKRYYATTLSRNDNERARVIIYRADGESPRRPLLVLVLREPVEPANPTPAGQ